MVSGYTTSTCSHNHQRLRNLQQETGPKLGGIPKHLLEQLRREQELHLEQSPEEATGRPQLAAKKQAQRLKEHFLRKE